MHPNPAYRQTPRDRNLSFVRARGFGTLVTSGPEAPLLSHVPFLLSADATHADLHLVRSNPIIGALATPQQAVLAVTGPDAYISPEWYGMEHQVPTWNYVAVHLRGSLERLPQQMLRDQLDRLSEVFETRLSPKEAWRTVKMPGDILDRMMRAICPVRLTITAVDGTWKLAQNKPEAARRSAADALAPEGPGQEVAALAALMRAATA